MLLITLSAKRPGAKNGNIQAMSATPFSSSSSCARGSRPSAPPAKYSISTTPAPSLFTPAIHFVKI